MAPPIMDELERDAEAQRAELAQRFEQFTESVRLRNISGEFTTQSIKKVRLLGASAAAGVARNPIPWALGVAVVLLFLSRQRRAPKIELPVSLSVGTAANPALSVSQNPKVGLAAKIGRTAGEVFENWAGTLSTSIEQFALQLTREAAQSLVRAADAMIATGLERLAQTLAQMSK
jgi:hypothetical protein